MLDLIHSVPISASAKDVYDAIATQKGMQGWWTRDTTLDARAGGNADFGFVNRAVVFRMVIDFLEPGKAVQMSCSGDQSEWAGTRLEWQIESTPDGSVLNFAHRDWRAMTAYCASCNSTWGELMYRLKAYVETKRPNPRWTD